MRDYGKVLTAFWTQGTGKRLRDDPDAQRLALYLMTCPASSMIGIFYLPLPTLCHEVGMREPAARKALARLKAEDFAHYDFDAELVWLPSGARIQLDETLKEKDHRRAGVLRELETYRRHPFARAFLALYGVPFGLGDPLGSPLEAPSKPLPSQDQDQEQEQDQKQEQDHSESSEPGGPASEPIAVEGYPIVGRLKSWDLTEALLAEFQEAFPHRDVIADCRAAKAWCVANPRKRKTADGMPKFLFGWIGRQQNGQGARAGPAMHPRTQGNLAAYEEVIRDGT